MAGNKIMGTVVFKIGSEKQAIGDGEFTVNISGRKREPIPGTSDYKETEENTFLKGEMLLRRGIKTKDVTNATKKTVMLVGANGTTYVLKDNAYYGGDPEIQASAGKLPVEFYAGPDDGDEITP